MRASVLWGPQFHFITQGNTFGQHPEWAILPSTIIKATYDCRDLQVFSLSKLCIMGLVISIIVLPESSILYANFLSSHPFGKYSDGQIHLCVFYLLSLHKVTTYVNSLQLKLISEGYLYIWEVTSFSFSVISYLVSGGHIRSLHFEMHTQRKYLPSICKDTACTLNEDQRLPHVFRKFPCYFLLW